MNGDFYSDLLLKITIKVKICNIKKNVYTRCVIFYLQKYKNKNDRNKENSI